MYFKQVALDNFRNYKKEIVIFHPKVNIITGMNAQGKTNLLESLYIMSLGKSFRTNKDSEMIGFEEDFCNAKACYIKGGRESTVEINISNLGKGIKIDGVRAQKNSDLLDNVYSVIFSPEDLKIVKEEPEKRRKFIDRELCQLKPVYYQNLARYKKILQQRNTLLKQGKNDEVLLDVWDKSLAEYGSKIIIERKSFIEKLNLLSRELHSKITNTKEKLELFYESNVPIQENLELSCMFLEKLKKGRKKDFYRGSTGAGPHKDDLKICIDGIDIRHFGSQGQQRTAALSLKLAEIHLIKEEKGEEAILLLDDVLSELDQERQRFLIESLSEVQLFITTTELGDFLLSNMPSADVFIVTHGKVSKVEKRFDKKAL